MVSPPRCEYWSVVQSFRHHGHHFTDRLDELARVVRGRFLALREEDS